MRHVHSRPLGMGKARCRSIHTELDHFYSTKKISSLVCCTSSCEFAGDNEATAATPGPHVSRIAAEHYMRKSSETYIKHVGLGKELNLGHELTRLLKVWPLAPHLSLIYGTLDTS